MNILYVVICCKKRLLSHMKIVENTWGKKIDPQDGIIILTGMNQIDAENAKREAEISYDILGYDVGDGYESNAKHMSFFKRFEAKTQIDWFYFCDDDTFIFTKRLKNLLANYMNDNTSVCVARRGFHDGAYYPDGGAGYAINQHMFGVIKNFLNSTPTIKMHATQSDASLGFWCRDLNIGIIDRTDVLKHAPPKHPENKNVNINSIVSYHWCSKDDFEFLNGLE